MKTYIKRVYNSKKDNFFELVANKLKNKEKQFIITVNPETLMISKNDAYLRKMLKDEDVCLTPDGISIVRAAKRLKIPIKERIAGIDITVHLLDIANDNNYSIYLFGSKKKVITTFARKIKKYYPNIKLLGYTNGYVENKEEVMQKIIKLNPDICFVALGIPEQEKLIYKYYKQAKKGVYIGVGGTFDVLSGMKKRAPELLIKLNLEWLYRIAKEPKRLKRFCQNNVKFIAEIRKEAKRKSSKN